jgi:L-aminopeptidase/D-esterase-like protein
VFRATVECVEEAIINALVAAKTMKGINGNTFHELPHQELQKMVEEYNKTFYQNTK